MQDIAIYARLNAEATERAIPQEVAKGKHVVAHYEGLAFFGHKAFDTRAEAETFAADLNKQLGVTTKIYSPQGEGSGCAEKQTEAALA